MENSKRILLNHARLLVETAENLKENHRLAQNQISNLKHFLLNAETSVATLGEIIRITVENSRDLLAGISDSSEFKSEMEKIEDKLEFLESSVVVKSPESLNFSQGKCKDINEKYPENLSKESLIDLNNVVNLPPVPEDIFTGFYASKPVRSSSLSSLKSMRKVKMFLQKAENSEDEEVSDDDRDLNKSVHGDSDDGKLSAPHSPKKFLGNIKEEMPD